MAIALLQKHGFTQFADEISWKHECGDIEVYDGNYTYNTVPMANACGLYGVVYQPSSIGVETAEQAIPHLREGIANMERNRTELEKLNPPNGWGSYEGFLRFAREILSACEDSPDAAYHAL